MSIICALLSVLVPAAAGIAEIHDDGKDVIRTKGKREILRYRHGGELIKPYVIELRTPSGVNILRDSPSDHKHHHGLMFAVAVDGVNFWEEVAPFGREVGRSILVKEPGGLVQQIDWIGPGGTEPLLKEARVIQVKNSPGLGATLLTWQSEVRLPTGKASARISGANYFGLGMRFVESMDKDGRFLNADGKTGVKETKLVRSAWCAYSAQVDGKPVTVAIFDHPGNVRHPATWFTMEKPFSYLAVTLGLDKEPILIQKDKPLVLCYGVAVWDGTPTGSAIEALYRNWLAQPLLGGQVPSSTQAKP